MHQYVFRLVLGSLLLSNAFNSHAQSATGYKLQKTFHIQSAGGWDYLAVNDGKIYVSHGNQVNILDETSGDSLGVITGTDGVHGIAFVPALKKGFISNGRLNSITVFSLEDQKKISDIPVGQNPDAIFYDPWSKMIITCNGRSSDLSVVDPTTLKLVRTVPVSGKPETAVSDEAGRVFVNIEDKNAIGVIDMTAGKQIKSYPLSPAEGPTGLVIDTKTKQLFAGCEKLLVGLDYNTGKITSMLPIADGCDGVAFDPEYRYLFASCGEGMLYIAQEKEDGAAFIVDSIASKRSARTITNDPANHMVYLPAADMGTAAPGKWPPMVPGSFQILVFGKP